MAHVTCLYLAVAFDRYIFCLVVLKSQKMYELVDLVQDSVGSAIHGQYMLNIPSCSGTQEILEHINKRK